MTVIIMLLSVITMRIKLVVAVVDFAGFVDFTRRLGGINWPSNVSNYSRLLWPTTTAPQSACIVICCRSSRHLFMAICLAVLWFLPKCVAFVCKNGFYYSIIFKGFISGKEGQTVSLKLK